MDLFNWDKIERVGSYLAYLVPYGLGDVFLSEDTLVTSSDEKEQLRRFHSSRDLQKEGDMRLLLGAGAEAAEYTAKAVVRSVEKSPLRLFGQSLKLAIGTALAAVGAAEVTDEIQEGFEEGSEVTVGQLRNYVEARQPGRGDEIVGQAIIEAAILTREQYNALKRVGQVIAPGLSREEQVRRAAQFITALATVAQANPAAIAMVALDPEYGGYAAY